ncbi:MAG: hypothetical protein H0V12_09910, partial [Chloroflexi bacterium]|nr:hypothetical protein [Chloroflexota bacterium]
MSVPAGVAGREDETPDAGPWRPAGHWTPGGPPGTVTVVGLGKIGLPLAAQYAQAGWHVIGVDVAPAVVEGLNAGRSHVAEEPGLSELVARSHAEGRLEATL